MQMTIFYKSTIASKGRPSGNDYRRTERKYKLQTTEHKLVLTIFIDFVKTF